MLETMYRGMGFTRTMIFMRDTRANTMRARFGFGADVERIIPKCNFPLAFAPDVFHVAIEKGVDIAIEDTQAANIIGRIPQWHRRGDEAEKLLLLPIVLKNHTIGLLYADAERTGVDEDQRGAAGPVADALRSQVVLAVKHSVGAGQRTLV